MILLVKFVSKSERQNGIHEIKVVTTTSLHTLKS
jgi:hypothetical protein